MMTKLRGGQYGALAVLTLAVSWACRDSANPPSSPRIDTGGALHQVLWAGDGSPRFAIGASVGKRVPTSSSAAVAGPASVTFWAYTDRDASLTINVQAADGSWQPYVTIRVPHGALLRRPDGSAFDLRDSVAITVTPDTTLLSVELQPSGLVFNPLVPAQLSISYQQANPDFNRDGVVDSTDDYIRQVLMGMSTRASVTDPWSVIPSVNDLVNQQILADLQHFTGYALSW